MNVEIWSDIACPWCYVGKRRLEAALAEFEHRDHVEVRWRSFELDPAAPPERTGDGAAHLAAKYATSRTEALAMQQRMTASAAAEGLGMRFDIARGGNTFDAHRLLHLAQTLGRQDALKERLMSAYLTAGELISDHQVLSRLAAESGLDEGAVRETLATHRFADDVREDERTASELGITAVPFFVVDRAFAASGAQSPELLGRLLQRGWEARPAPLATVAGGESCAFDGR